MAKGSLIGLKSGKLGNIVMYARKRMRRYRIHRASVMRLFSAANVTDEMMNNFAARAIVLGVNTKTDNNATCNGAATDKVTICLYNVAKKAFVHEDNAASRADAIYQYSMPNNWAGDDFEAYIFFTDADQKAVTKTQSPKPST